MNILVLNICNTSLNCLLLFQVKVERKEFSDGVSRSDEGGNRLGGSSSRRLRPGQHDFHTVFLFFVT